MIIKIYLTANIIYLIIYYLYERKVRKAFCDVMFEGDKSCSSVLKINRCLHKTIGTPNLSDEEQLWVISHTKKIVKFLNIFFFPSGILLWLVELSRKHRCKKCFFSFMACNYQRRLNCHCPYLEYMIRRTPHFKERNGNLYYSNKLDYNKNLDSDVISRSGDFMVYLNNEEERILNKFKSEKLVLTEFEYSYILYHSEEEVRELLKDSRSQAHLDLIIKYMQLKKKKKYLDYNLACEDKIINHRIYKKFKRTVPYYCKKYCPHSNDFYI